MRTQTVAPPLQIRSKARVKALAEVFTGEREVNAMLDLIPHRQFEDPLASFLEPACGNGNFLVAILERKMAYRPNTAKADIYALKVLSSLYGIDIDQQNIAEAICRLHSWLDEHIVCDDKQTFLKRAKAILIGNIQVGDFLAFSTLQFIQYQWLSDDTYTTALSA
ncbi:hypothetical protein ACTJNK_13510 [Achromobacter anxifer]